MLRPAVTAKGGAYATRWVGILTVCAALTLLLPNRLVVAPLHSLGSLSVLCGVALAPALARTFLTGARAGQLSTIQLGLVTWAGVAFASYLVTTVRPLDQLERAAADRGLAQALSALLVGLFAAAAPLAHAQLAALTRRLAALGAALAFTAVLQFAGFDAAQKIHLPGFEAIDGQAVLVQFRSGFRRASGMSAHPLELASVLGMLAPLVLYALVSAKGLARWGWWAAAVLYFAAIAMTMTRTSLLLGVTVAAFLVPTLPPRFVLRLCAAAALGVIAMWLLFPGLVGSLRALVVYARVDPSVLERASDYQIVRREVASHPLFGRGIGTFVPLRYIFVDNQFLTTAVEQGLAGLGALVAVPTYAIVAAQRRMRGAGTTDERLLGQALACSVAVAMVTSLTFDIIAFGASRFTMFLTLGLCGAYCRPVTQEQAQTKATQPTAPPCSQRPIPAWTTRDPRRRTQQPSGGRRDP